MPRKAKIIRKTKETSIDVEANIDGKGSYNINTKIGFLNHMLEQLSKHSLIDITIKAKGPEETWMTRSLGSVTRTEISESLI